ncbi:MAG: hypothetical protein Q8P05_03975 [Candidatus Diapherotrites archaeon]|nr:hypothetical protein [Candidatus Diapherotrites archaeon]
MSNIYIFFIPFVLLLSIGFVYSILSRFKTGLHFLSIFVFPMVLFSLGFLLRVSTTGDLADIGFFFTEFSFVIIYVLFTISFFIGQIKYWGLSKASGKNAK